MGNNVAVNNTILSLFLTRQTPARLASLELLGLNFGDAQKCLRKSLCNSKRLADFIPQTKKYICKFIHRCTRSWRTVDANWYQYCIRTFSDYEV